MAAGASTTGRSHSESSRIVTTVCASPSGPVDVWRTQGGSPQVHRPNSSKNRSNNRNSKRSRPEQNEKCVTYVAGQKCYRCRRLLRGGPASLTCRAAPRSILEPVCVPSASSHLHGDRAQEVLLADLDAAVTQDRVGGGQVEIDVRQHEMVEIVVALHLALVGGTERKGDLTIARGIDLLGGQGFEKGEGFSKPCLELIDGRLSVLETGRLDAAQPRHAVLGQIGG